MLKRLGISLTLFTIFLSASITATATNTGFTTLDVNGEAVRIYRDDFGAPHIFAETNGGLFEAYGYTVAQDRLWQLELNRRAARGRLAEIFGPTTVNADRAVRVTGYTDAELDAQFATLTSEEQEIFDAYVAGINRYIGEVALNPLAKLPFEFHALGFFPQPWTRRDSIAFGVFMVRRFGEIGGRELTNLAVLDSLIAAHGPVNGFAIFNDVRWVNDPDSPVTVPTSGAIGKSKNRRLWATHNYRSFPLTSWIYRKTTHALPGSRWACQPSLAATRGPSVPLAVPAGTRCFMVDHRWALVCRRYCTKFSSMVEMGSTLRAWRSRVCLPS
jgi:acyl-homoserine lactone acylase PvdQ